MDRTIKRKSLAGAVSLFVGLINYYHYMNIAIHQQRDFQIQGPPTREMYDYLYNRNICKSSENHSLDREYI